MTHYRVRAEGRLAPPGAKLRDASFGSTLILAPGEISGRAAPSIRLVGYFPEPPAPKRAHHRRCSGQRDNLISRVAQNNFEYVGAENRA
jgi:hypothetical protein